MAEQQYKTGSVSIDINTSTVTGVGTAFLTAGVQAGDRIKFAGNPAYYPIQNVPSETELALVGLYLSASLTNHPYHIIRDFTANLNLALPTSGAGDNIGLIRLALIKLDEAFASLGVTMTDVQDEVAAQLAAADISGQVDAAVAVAVPAAISDEDIPALVAAEVTSQVAAKISHSLVATTNNAGVVNLDLSQGNAFVINLSATVNSVTLSNVPQGAVVTDVLIIVTQSNGGNHTINWTASGKFEPGDAGMPTQVLTNGAVEMYFGVIRDGINVEAFSKGWVNTP